MVSFATDSSHRVLAESFRNEKSAVGMKSQKPAKQDGRNDTIILSHHPRFANYALSLLCAYRRVVEGSGVGSALSCYPGGTWTEEEVARR